MGMKTERLGDGNGGCEVVGMGQYLAHSLGMEMEMVGEGKGSFAGVGHGRGDGRGGQRQRDGPWMVSDAKAPSPV